jgi:hypothetical protein
MLNALFVGELGGSMWYPIDGRDLPDEPADGANNVAVAIRSEDTPSADLLVNWVETEKDLSESETLSLGFAPFNLDEKGDHRTIVLDAMRYIDKDNVRWGVGVRFVLHAWSETTSVKGAVALVAAQASLNMVYTRATVQIIGCKSSDLVKSLPRFEEMTVSDYTDLMKALDACRDAVYSAAAADLTPMPIAVSLPGPSPDNNRDHWPFHIHHRQQ